MPIDHLTITAVASTRVLTITIFTITIHNLNIMIIKIDNLRQAKIISYKRPASYNNIVINKVRIRFS
jgi:hypothetical protein